MRTSWRKPLLFLIAILCIYHFSATVLAGGPIIIFVGGYVKTTKYTKGIPVRVNCNGNISDAVTDGNGRYLASFSHGNCNSFDLVTASTTYQGRTQSKTVLVSSESDTIIDLDLTSVTDSPINLFAGLSFAMATAGVFSLVFIKRKSIKI